MELHDPTERSSTIHASWNSAQLSMKEVDELLTELISLVKQIASSQNWEKRIGALCNQPVPSSRNMK